MPGIILEAERNGKPIEKVVGNSPKEYMKMLSREMDTDNKNWFKYICIIIFGSFSFRLFPDLMDLNLSCSVLEIVGHIIFGIVFILFAFAGFRYITNQSARKQAVVLAGMVLLLSALSFDLIYLNKVIASPIIHFGTIGSLIVAVFIILFFIVLVFWATK
ncbi:MULTISPECIES: HAAS domain-containing protein [unclassified Oceanobacillus]|uniref:HAAS domain-containing protein n=1 Tax=unclassified Oceanobacillus TaxID=2630292 RepID=UPI00300E1BCF